MSLIIFNKKKPRVFDMAAVTLLPATFYTTVTGTLTSDATLGGSPITPDTVFYTTVTGTLTTDPTLGLNAESEQATFYTSTV